MYLDIIKEHFVKTLFADHIDDRSNRDARGFHINNEIPEDGLEAKRGTSQGCTTYPLLINDSNNVFSQIRYLQHHFQVSELDSIRNLTYMQKGPQTCKSSNYEAGCISV